jgi:3,4-dihydroxy 2-butanone 4-phosphate synthase/GTP cyclohydrolase II
MPLVSVEQAVEDFKNGRMVIIVDDEDRENEGDLAIPAQMVTPDIINFMATYGRGLICMPIIGERLKELELPMMVDVNTSRNATAFTVSVDVTIGASTGISAHDRAATVRALLDTNTRPEDLEKPGHLFPLRYQEGGVLVRAGQTEGSVDLSKLADMYPAAVICEIMKEDGTMSRMPDLEEFSDRHNINIVSVAQIIEHRRFHENLVQQIASARLPTKHGEFTAEAFTSAVDSAEHLALVMGDVNTNDPVMVRVHSECLTGDVMGSERCDCGAQIDMALRLIGEQGRGVFLYMRQEGRGIGLHNKIKAYSLQDNGLDTVEANEALGFEEDLRHYGVGAQILVQLGVRNMRLLTNNPRKVVGLESYGLKLVERIPIISKSTPENENYMKTKHQKLGHILTTEEDKV